MLTAETYLEIVRGTIAERGTQYDKKSEKERSFQAVADCFYTKTGIRLTAAHIALILQDLKDVRLFQNLDSFHEDSAVDCIAYAALKAEALSKEFEEKTNEN